VEERGTARQAKEYNTIRRMRTACCITKTTDTQSDITIVCPLQQYLCERALILRYTYIIYIVIFKGQ